MATKVNREEFLSKLQSVAPGLAVRENIEQSTCFVFTEGFVFTFNDVVSCRIPLPLGDDFAGAVAAKPLLTLLEKLPDDELTISIADKELSIVGSLREAGIRIEQEIILDPSLVDQPEEWVNLPDEFCDAVTMVSTCAANDDSAFIRMCVHFHEKYLEACDNFQACRFKIKLGLGEFLVRRSSLKHVPALGVNEAGITDAWLHMRNPSGLVISCRRDVDEYPPLARIFDVEGSPATLPGGLAEAVGRAEIFSAMNADDNKVLIELRSNKIRIKGIGPLGWLRETKKFTYSGPPMEFLIDPRLLVEIGKRQNECIIATDKIKVDGGKWQYVSCLSLPEDKVNAPVGEEVVSE